MNDVQYFEIQAAEPEKAAQFYAAAFGWQCTQQPNMPIEYWRIETEGIRGAILKRPAPLPAPRTGTNAYVCSMQVADSMRSRSASSRTTAALRCRSSPSPGGAGKATSLIRRAIRSAFSRSILTPVECCEAAPEFRAPISSFSF
jgi:hypothetical protein